jgi:hypothetical protein
MKKSKWPDELKRFDGPGDEEETSEEATEDAATEE